jgi:MFS family permease
VSFLAKGNSTLQLAAAPHMRGRVMALWAVAFLGSTPIGGPIAGVITDKFGGRAGLVLGAVACLAAALLGVIIQRRAAGRPAPDQAGSPNGIGQSDGDQDVMSELPDAAKAPNRAAA